MNSYADSLGPLADGARVVIVGGGPGGVGTALALRKLAREMGRQVDITLFEGKDLEGERHFNQCAGVLSPPIVEILETSLDVPFPRRLIQREITRYALHSDTAAILLESDDPPAYSVRRVQFDHYMFEQARARGIQINPSRVTDLEFHADRVIVYSEGGNSEADAVVGAFGSDDGTAHVFERATPYRQPHFLSSIVTKVHPEPAFMDAFGKTIHAFLPSVPAIEFGAVTPKGDHLTINIAGDRIDAQWMERFLHMPAVQAVVPPPGAARHDDDLTFYRGRFPISPAHAFTGNRYVLVGDGAGLVRPFKGKGVNSALVTGVWAAETMLKYGISAAAFQEYHHAAREIINDLPYGRLMRALTGGLSRWRMFDAVIAVAREDERLRRALFDAVSAHRPYRTIIHGMLDPRWMVHAAPLLAGALMHPATASTNGPASLEGTRLVSEAPIPPKA